MDRSSTVFDFAVIGAGVVGSAIARELSGTDSSVALLEAREDVVEGTSKANTALLHTGFDAAPGTLESRLVARGYQLTRDFAERSNVSLDITGAVLVAWDQEQVDQLPLLQQKAVKNGYGKTERVDEVGVYALLPHLGPGALGGLVVPDEGVIDAWSLPLALATDAVQRGTRLLLDHCVRSIVARGGHHDINTTQGTIQARWVINAAGLGGDTIDQMFGFDRIHIHPRKGELHVFDKLASRLVDRIVLAVPSKKGKGVLVSPTAFGNVMLGPTADDIDDRTDTSTTESGFGFLERKGAHIFPALLEEEITASYAGLRAAHDLTDYLIEIDPPQRYVIVSAVRSTGLTSAMAIAEYVHNKLVAAGLGLVPRDRLPEPPQMPPLGEKQLRPHADGELIGADSAYGQIVCYCERVSAGEIRDAINSPIPPGTLSGLRRRTRAMNGRCQGFYCGAHVTAIFNEKAGDRHEPSN